MAGNRGQYNVRLIRRDLSYTVEEIVACLGVHENTVRDWIRKGLAVLDDKRPLLVHGAILIAFLRERQSARQVKLAVHEFYCVKCRCARSASDGKASVLPRNSLTVNISATCAVCLTTVHKVSNLKKLHQYRQIFDFTTLGEQHIFDTQTTSVNCDFNGERENEQEHRPEAKP